MTPMSSDCPTQSPVHILHAHTVYSTLDGASTVDEYVEYAKTHGLGACGICDHGYALGLHDLITKCNANGIKSLPGIEFYLSPRPGYRFLGKPYDYGHISLWAQNMQGYRTLLTLASISWQPGRTVTRFGKPKPRITWEDMEIYNEGLICGSGCIEGPIAKPLLRGEPEEAVQNAHVLKDIFGDRLYFEVMPHAVTKNYQSKNSKQPGVVSVTGEDGEVYYFLETDSLDTDRGPMLAKDAFQQQVTEVWSAAPERHQNSIITGPETQGIDRRFHYAEDEFSPTVEALEPLEILPLRSAVLQTLEQQDDSQTEYMADAREGLCRNRMQSANAIGGSAEARQRGSNAPRRRVRRTPAVNP